MMADGGLHVYETVALNATDLAGEGIQLTHVLIRQSKGSRAGKAVSIARALVKLGAYSQTQ